MPFSAGSSLELVCDSRTEVLDWNWVVVSFRSPTGSHVVQEISIFSDTRGEHGPLGLVRRVSAFNGQSPIWNEPATA